MECKYGVQNSKKLYSSTNVRVMGSLEEKRKLEEEKRRLKEEQDRLVSLQPPTPTINQNIPHHLKYKVISYSDSKMLTKMALYRRGKMLGAWEVKAWYNRFSGATGDILSSKTISELHIHLSKFEIAIFPILVDS